MRSFGYIGHSTLVLFSLLLSSFESQAQAVTRLRPTSPDYLDDFSASVALADADDGTWALIGAPGDNDATGDAGSVFAYYRSEEDGWQLHDQLFAPGEPLYQGGFGSAVALATDGALAGRLAVVTETGWAARNRAYVLRRDGEGMGSAWVLEAMLEPEALAHPEHIFGERVVLDSSAEAVAAGGAVAVVGAVTDETLDPIPGAVHVFRRGSVGAWAEEAVLQANEGEIADRFGTRIAANGRLLVGANLENDGEGTGGAAYFYTFDAATGWTQEARLAPEGVPGFGVGVALDGDVALIGAPGADCPDPSGRQCGAALLYHREDDGTWEQVQRIALDDPVEVDLFGRDVALTAERAVITAPFRQAEGRREAGAAYLYDLGEEGLALRRELTSLYPRVGGQLGVSLALTESVVLIGTNEALGAAYAFDIGAVLPNEPGIASIGRLALSVYPNPASDAVTLTLRLEAAEVVRVEVVDVLGRVVWTQSGWLSAGMHRLRPETAAWTPGPYLVRAHTAGAGAVMSRLTLVR